MTMTTRNFARRLVAAFASLALVLALLPAVPAPSAEARASASADTGTSASANAQSDDGTIRILCVGNSWSQRSIAYLCSIAKSAGKRVIIGQAFLKSSSLQEQYFGLLNGGGTYISNGKNRTVRTSYIYHKYVNSDEYHAKKNKTLEYAIQDEPWDYLVLQNRAPESGNYAVWDKSDLDNADALVKENDDGTTELVHFDVNDFVDLIESKMEPEVAAHLKVGLSAVWTYASGQEGGIASSIGGYIQAKRGGKYPHTQKQWDKLYHELDSDIQSTIREVARHMGKRCSFIVNPGLAFRYAREDGGLAGFGYKLHTSREDAHPAVGIPRYLASLTYAFAILGLSWDDVAFYPRTATTSYYENKRGTLVKRKVKPTATLAFRAVACAWQAQKGSSIDISGFAASPLFSRASAPNAKKAPALAVKSPSFGTLEEGVDFKVTQRYANELSNLLFVTFKGKGRFQGTGAAVTDLKPAAIGVKKAAGKRRAVRVSWKAPGKEKARGVQIRLTAKVETKVAVKVKVKAKGKKKERQRTVTRTRVRTVKRIVTVESSTRKKATVRKLARGTWNVQVRSYRMVSGKRYASAWSAAKTAHVR